LDGNHNVSCATCHASGDYTRYTCYGCHEHTPNAMIAKHAEEGIQDLASCVRCHRSASGEGGGEGGD
jgi:formate dehydrogenase maturation protein FdhE